MSQWPLIQSPYPKLHEVGAAVAAMLGIPPGSVNTSDDEPGTILVSVPAEVPQDAADAAWETVREMLPWGVALKVVPRVVAAQAKPKPAAGQVWQFQDSSGPFDFAIGRVESEHVFPVTQDDPFDYITTATLMQNRRWSCVGAETPAGRVMVGERRRHPCGTIGTVYSVTSGGCVMVQMADGSTQGWAAEDVARRWPLAAQPISYDAVRMTIDGKEVPFPVKVEAAPVRGLGAEPFGVTFVGSTNITPEEYERIARAILGKPAPKPDPRAEREARRRAIDAVLAEDARQHPAFATARKAAVMADAEREPMSARTARFLLSDLHKYEAARGGGRAPNPGASLALSEHDRGTVLAVYERYRSL